MASSYLTSRLLPHHRRHLSTATILTCCGGAAAIGVSSMTTTITTTAGATKKSNFHTTTVVRRPGYKPERNPKIGITLEQLRMAARGQGRRLPICHEQQERVMNSLEAAKYENHAIYRYIKEYDKCREEYDLLHKGKDKVLMRELNKYLVRPRKK